MTDKYVRKLQEEQSPIFKKYQTLSAQKSKAKLYYIPGPNNFFPLELPAKKKLRLQTLTSPLQKDFVVGKCVPPTY